MSRNLALYCDDVRDEVSGQSTLVGLYGETVEVEKFPMRVKQLCIVVFFHCPLPVDESDVLKLTFTFPNDHAPIDQDVSLFEVVNDHSDHAPSLSVGKKTRVDMRFFFHAVPIQKPGLATVTIARGEGEEIVGALTFVSRVGVTG